MLNKRADDTGAPAETDDIEGRIAAAATPSKRMAHTKKMEASGPSLSPPEMVLDSLLESTQDKEALIILDRNVVQVADTISSIAKEVYHLSRDVNFQGVTQDTFCDKVNYLAGIVGNPPASSPVPNLWTAVMELLEQARLHEQGDKNPRPLKQVQHSQHSTKIC
ncbi:hypothetical protein ACA910_015174 [Epithemia clementina (nom. ined.)]